jgi:hypothetical protein
LISGYSSPVKQQRGRRGLEQAIWEDILRTLAQNPDIELAYPSQRPSFHSSETKTPDSSGSS